MDQNSPLTKDYMLFDFVVSAQQPLLLKEIREHLLQIDRVKMWLLAVMYLQRLTDHFGERHIPLSGKRSDPLNRMIGGSDTSDHLFIGETAAVDFTRAGSVEDSFNFICASDWAWGQVIHYPTRRFIHISLPSKKHFREKMISENGTYRHLT